MLGQKSISITRDYGAKGMINNVIIEMFNKREINIMLQVSFTIVALRIVQYTIVCYSYQSSKATCLGIITLRLILCICKFC